MSKSQRTKGKEGEWNDDLVCNLVYAESLPGRVVLLQLSDGDCCDMDGAVKVSTEIDPSVRYIRSMSGDKLDATYKRVAGVWKLDKDGDRS